ALGAQVIAVDIDENTLKLARELGATLTVNASESSDVIAEVKELTRGGAHVSLDALGNQITCFNSIANLRKRGKHIQVGLMAGKDQHPNIPMDRVIANELEILGSHGMQAYKYPEMLDMIRSGSLHPDKLIEKTISLKEAPEALMNMNSFTQKGVWVVDSF
ncbi:MAG: zinc-binding dehydrogenase, partial [Bacteroidota bacterium]